MKLDKPGRLTRVAVALALAAVTALPVLAADTFPSRPIRIVVATAAGGWGDNTVRLVGQKLSEKLGQPVVIDNRPGADGLVGIRHVKSAPADGYTLLSTGATIMLQPTVKKDPGYDLAKDFVGVGGMARSPAVLVVSATRPEKSVADLVKNATAEPGGLSYGSAGVGSATHIPAEMFLQQSHLTMLHVPYKGNGAGLADLIAGRVSVMFDAYSSSVGNLKGGRLRALAVTSQARLPALPEVPTLAEQGLPGFSYYYWLGLFAPAGTPPQVVQRINTALREALASPELRDRMQSEATEPFVMAPAEFDTYLRGESTRMSEFATGLGWVKE